jgi:alpha-ketoglutaric semialdehyde dehydrogenase
MTTSLFGQSFIGHCRSSGARWFCNARRPGTGERLEPPYYAASEEEIEKAVQLADQAFPIYQKLPVTVRAGFLRRIASEIERAVEEIVLRGGQETALSEERLRSEARRTMNHLGLFAECIEEGSWADARIERADPSRHPLPKPDLRSMLCPLGPVVVFCAGNFPLAYSVAGGDTVSALASGCPVIVIAHEGHPGVAEIVAAAVVRASVASGLPDGVFSMLYGGGRSVGVAVVEHPLIQAVGFTGSRAGGTALMEIAARRPRPIPVFAEMSSINPVVILPGALERDEEGLAEGFFHSLTHGVGQFCTNPGLVFLTEETGGRFIRHLKSLVEQSRPGMMLNDAICQSFDESIEAVSACEGVEVLARSLHSPGEGEAAPVVFRVRIEDFIENPSLQREMFGPATLFVFGSSREIEEALLRLEGQLTASLHATEEELDSHQALVEILRRRAGRLVFNGFPTGVEVCTSTVHGGPYPATSEGRSSSVGTLAIGRFCRHVAWQGFPDAALPPELRDGNPLGIRRMEEGKIRLPREVDP